MRRLVRVLFEKVTLLERKSYPKVGGRVRSTRIAATTIALISVSENDRLLILPIIGNVFARYRYSVTPFLSLICLMVSRVVNRNFVRVPAQEERASLLPARRASTI